MSYELDHSQVLIVPTALGLEREMGIVRDTIERVTEELHLPYAKVLLAQAEDFTKPQTEAMQQVMHETLLPSGEVDFTKLMFSLKGSSSTLLKEEARKDALLFALVGQPLHHLGIGAYGVYFRSFMLGIQADAYGNRTKDRQLSENILRVLTAHEFGHWAQLAQSRQNNVTSKDNQWLKEHCAGERGPCAMQQVDMAGCVRLPDLAEQLLRKKIETLFCNDCLQEREQILRRMSIDVQLLRRDEKIAAASERAAENKISLEPASTFLGRVKQAFDPRFQRAKMDARYEAQEKETERLTAIFRESYEEEKKRRFGM